jgi:hypothetical protein
MLDPVDVNRGAGLFARHIRRWTELQGRSASAAPAWEHPPAAMSTIFRMSPGSAGEQHVMYPSSETG